MFPQEMKGLKMKCDKCSKNFPEKELQLSHDVPRYIGGTDLDGRHWLCKKCHGIYEWKVIKMVWNLSENKEFIKEHLKLVSKLYFKNKRGKNDTNTTTKP